ncbi:transposable element Tcb2 transposase [Trichonephila clavipes]|nr:transposable element Tcb2 transposase [Trichonephila clavipes]
MVLNVFGYLKTSFFWQMVYGHLRNWSSCAADQFHSNVSLEAVDLQAQNNWKTGSGRRKVMSGRDNRHVLRMEVNDRTASFRQMEARWSTATCVLTFVSSIRRRLLHRGLTARVPLYRISLKANHRPLRLQSDNEHRAWQADWP